MSTVAPTNPKRIPPLLVCPVCGLPLGFQRLDTRMKGKIGNRLWVHAILDAETGRHYEGCYERN